MRPQPKRHWSPNPPARPGRRPSQAESLFGEPVSVPTPAPRAGSGRAITNDMDLIESVIKTAREPGYVLIGPAQRVWRRHTERVGHVERVPAYEDTAVHQLIDAKLFTIGGGHHVRYGRREGRANSVLVTREAARDANRWAAYQRPTSWGPRRHTGQGGAQR